MTSPTYYYSEDDDYLDYFEIPFDEWISITGDYEYEYDYE